jgi:hypothetical protein
LTGAAANGLSVRSGLVVVLSKLKNTNNKNPIHIVKTSSQPNQKTNVGWDW